MAAALIEPNQVPKEIRREVKTLNDNIDKIMQHEGKHVLVQGTSVVGFYPSYEAALNAGYQNFGLEAFIVKEVQSHEPTVRAMRCGVAATDGRPRIDRAKRR